MVGHVFIVRGALSSFACDAWLMPCDSRAKPRASFFPQGYKPRAGDPFIEPGPRTKRFEDWPNCWPQPWLTHVGGFKKSPVAWYMEAVREFLKKAGQEVSPSGYSPRYRRARPLLAMPVIGTGAGGAAERAGEVMQALLPILDDFIQTHDIDVAVVERDTVKHTAAQAERARRFQEQGNCWAEELREDLRREAQCLAKKALSGRLALFLGAGLSMAAGLPSWSDLLKELGQRAGMSEAELEGLFSLENYLDQATYLERRLVSTTIGAAIRDIFDPLQAYALGHALLATLPVHEVITTNYDQLFDNAWSLVDDNGVSILPGR